MFKTIAKYPCADHFFDIILFMGKILRKTGFAFAVPLCLAFTVACTDYSSDINDLHGRLDEIESSRIASIDGQLKAINATIPQLEKTDADLKEMIENLQKTADGLGKSISDNGESISNLKTDLEKAVENLRNSDKSDKEYVLDSLAKAKAVLLALLESEKAELEGKLVLVNNAVADLRKKDAELEKAFLTLRYTQTRN